MIARIHLCGLLAISIALSCTAHAEPITNYVSAEFMVQSNEVYVGETFEIRLKIRSHSVTLGQDFRLNPNISPSMRRISKDFSHYDPERVINSNRTDDIQTFGWISLVTEPGTIHLTSTLDLSLQSRKNRRLLFSTPKT
jgi:hypothetical protein